MPSARLLLPIFLLLAFPLHAGHAQSSASAPLALVGVTVIDVESGARLPDQLVVVAGERITYAGPNLAARIPARSRRVDGRGKFLLPGLWDMHMHTQEPAETSLLVMLATGITGARDLHAGVEDAAATSVRLRDEVRAGSRIGPRLVVGANLTGWDDPRATLLMTRTPERGRAIVDSLAALKVDLLKVLSLVDRLTYFAVMDQAKKHGLPVDGHAPISVSAAEASEAGQRTLEHVGEGGVLFGCAAAGDRFQAEWLEAITMPRTPARAARVRHNFAAAGRAFDEDACRALARTLVRNGTGWAPTLVTEHMGTATYAWIPSADSVRRYAPAAHWAALDAARTAPQSDADTAVFRALLRRDMEIVRLMQREGVTILAGSDVSLKGFSLHEELAMLVSAGLSPLEALRAATINPARILGLPLGLVREGMLADLLLLDADPTLDIANASRIRAVLANGRYFDRPALDGMLTRAAAVIADYDARARP